MRGRLWLIGIAALAFVLVLLLRLPLSWVRAALPANVTCAKPSGSIWQGRCDEFGVVTATGALALGPLSWDLQPAALLRARIAGTVRIDGPQLHGTSRFVAGLARNLRVEDLDAVVPLDRRFLGMVPANWTGRLLLKFPRAELRKGQLTLLQGRLEAHDIVAQGPRPDAFGSYALEFPAATAPGSAFAGQLRDLAGPIELAGALNVQPNLDWELDALVKARPSATVQLSKLLEYLGPPDAQGRRRFSAAGDF